MEEEIITGKRKAISNWIVKMRTIINLRKNTYMIQQTVFGLFKSGTFQKLPPLDYVLIAKTFFNPACEACRLDEDEKLFYQVSLVYRGNRRIIVTESKNPAEAFNMANQLSYKLALSLKDVTERGNAKWKKVVLNYQSELPA